MKRVGIVALTVLTLTACGDGGEKQARLKLQMAEQALAKGDYNKAKLQLDSIKILYPKAFNARKEGINVLQRVELEEQQKSILFLDSMLQVKQAEFESIQKRFVLEKDAEYQKIGNYFYPSQTVEKNLHRSYLRAQVNEQGAMSFTSIYCGGSHIHHSAVKVTTGDGTFAETPPTKDSYETSDLGEKIEKADYKLGEDGDVIGYIYLNKDKNIKVEYLGDKKYSNTLSAADRNAFAELYSLSRVLSSMEQIKKEIKEANLKIEFIQRKMSEKRDETQSL